MADADAAHARPIDRIEVLASEGAALISAVREGPGDADVPTCPGWDVTALAGHMGKTWRWSTRIVSNLNDRDIDFDASFMTPWAALYERSHALLPDVVRTYDRAWWQLRSEVRQVREKVLELHAQLEQGGGPVAEENVRLRADLLRARDDLVGHEARLGEALGRIELLEIELRRHQDALAAADAVLGSRTGRLLRAWHRVRVLLR